MQITQKIISAIIITFIASCDSEVTDSTSNVISDGDETDACEEIETDEIAANMIDDIIAEGVDVRRIECWNQKTTYGNGTKIFERCCGSEEVNICETIGLCAIRPDTGWEECKGKTW